MNKLINSDNIDLLLCIKPFGNKAELSDTWRNNHYGYNV